MVNSVSESDSISQATPLPKGITGKGYFGNDMVHAPNQKVHQHLRRLNAICKAIPTLQKDSWRWDNNSNQDYKTALGKPTMGLSGSQRPFILELHGRVWLLRLPGAGSGLYILCWGGQRMMLMNRAE